MIELNKIYCENCLDTMSRMPNDFIDLTVTSPPYDNLRNYNGYDFDFESIAKELFRVTKKGGVVVWVVGDATINGSETGTSFKQALYFKGIGFNLDTMIYGKTGGMFSNNISYPNIFEYMFIFSKGLKKTINLIKDKKNKGFGKLYISHSRDKNGNQKYSPTQTLTPEFSFRGNIWFYDTGGSVSDDNISHQHPAIFPEDLARDHIKSWSNEGDLIYDPFMGSGTTAKMAHLLNRNWIGSEISSEYCKIAEKRIDPYLRQQKIIFK